MTAERGTRIYSVRPRTCFHNLPPSRNKLTCIGIRLTFPLILAANLTNNLTRNSFLSLSLPLSAAAAAAVAQLGRRAGSLGQIILALRHGTPYPCTICTGNSWCIIGLPVIFFSFSHVGMLTTPRYAESEADDAEIRRKRGCLPCLLIQSKVGCELGHHQEERTSRGQCFGNCIFAVDEKSEVVTVSLCRILYELKWWVWWWNIMWRMMMLIHILITWCSKVFQFPYPTETLYFIYFHYKFYHPSGSTMPI